MLLCSWILRVRNLDKTPVMFCFNFWISASFSKLGFHGRIKPWCPKASICMSWTNFSPVHLEWYQLCTVLGRMAENSHSNHFLSSLAHMRNLSWERLAGALGGELKWLGGWLKLDQNLTRSSSPIVLLPGLEDLKAKLSKDCQLDHQHMASPCGLDFFTEWQLQGSWKSKCPNGQGRSYIAFYDPASEVTENTFCRPLLVEAVKTLPTFQKKGHGPCLLMAGMSKNFEVFKNH